MHQPPLAHFRGRGAADGTVCGDGPGWCPGVAVDVAENGGADVAAGADDEDVEGGREWRCGGPGVVTGVGRGVIAGLLWGPGEKGFVDFRVMPRCAGLEGAKKMPGVN